MQASIRFTRRAAVVAAGVALLIPLAACSAPAEEDGPTTLRVGIVPVTPWLPVMVAEAEGIFDAHGLNVEITKVQQSPSAAIGQQFEIGQATGSDFVQAVNGGLDQVLISNIAYEGDTTSALMVPADSDISSLEDFEGARVGVATRSSVMAQSLIYLLHEAGVDTSTVTLQEMPFPTMSDQLAAGQVDAIAPVEPFASQAEAAGAVRLLNPTKEAGLDASGGGDVPVLFAASSREWAESHPEEVEAWRASLAEAIEFIEANEDEARAILQEFTGLPAEVAQNVELFRQNSSAVEPGQIGLWIDVLEISGTLPKDNDLDPANLVVD